jgi:hypothetical protein
MRAYCWQLDRVACGWGRSATMPSPNLRCEVPTHFSMFTVLMVHKQWPSMHTVICSIDSCQWTRGDGGTDSHFCSDEKDIIFFLERWSFTISKVESRSIKSQLTNTESWVPFQLGVILLHQHIIKWQNCTKEVHSGQGWKVTFLTYHPVCKCLVVTSRKPLVTSPKPPVPLKLSNKPNTFLQKIIIINYKNDNNKTCRRNLKLRGSWLPV